MNNELENTVLANLKKQVLDNNLFWKEPYSFTEEDGSIYHEFFGNGPQGSEPARFAMFKDENKILSFVCSRIRLEAENENDHFSNYVKYLELNGWK